MRIRKANWIVFRFVGLVLPLLLFSPLPILHNTPSARCAYTVLVMAVYWTLELLPLPVTSLLPVVMFPLLGVSDTNTVAKVYMKGIQMMYLGSLMMALAVEGSGLHRRIALRALLLAGTKPVFLMLGFMLPTAFLSMWISNAATTAMMVPILDAVMNELSLEGGEKTMMLLSVAYAANVGGTGTIIGTPPNLILMEFLSDFQDHPLNFGSWMAFSLPEAILNLFIVWITLCLFFQRHNFRKVFKKCSEAQNNVKTMLQENYDDLGPLTFHETAVLTLFSALVLIWFFQKPGFMPGWVEALQWQSSSGSVVSIGSATPTILIIILLFVIPSKPTSSEEKSTLLNWGEVQKKFPWGIILLMGGGFALAEGSKASCLTYDVGSLLTSLEGLPPSLILLVLCLFTSLISSIASNSATTSMVIPVVLTLSRATNIHPLYLSIGVTLTASHSFVLPVSTPPNAIVYTSGGLSIKDMARVGVVLNMLCIASTFFCLHSYGVPMYQLNSYPAWAEQNITSSSFCH